VARDEQQAHVVAGGPEFADDADQQRLFAFPGGGAEQHQRAWVGAEAEVGAQTRAFVGGHRRIAGDVELDVARERGVEAEFAEAAHIFFAAGGDLLEMTEHVGREFPEAPVAGEGLVGDAPVDQKGWDAAGAGLGEVFGPELAFDKDDGVRADAAPGEPAARPKVGREDADAVGDVGVAIPGESVACAGRGRQDDLGSPRGLELTEEGADGFDFAHRDRLNPVTALSGGLRA